MNMKGLGAVVVTGASKGIGRACALHLDRLGFQVFAGVRRDEDGQALRREASDRLVPVLLDVTDAASIEDAEGRVAEAVGATGLAGLVNNAGVAVAGPLEFLPLSELRRQLEVNVIGQIAVTQAMLPHLRRSRGRVVNIGSISGKSSLPFTGAYGASKHALEALTDALRVELMPWGIEVSIVEPGVIATPIWQTSIRAAEAVMQDYPPEAHEYYGAAIEKVRAGVAANGETGRPPEDVARVVAHALTARRPRTRYLVGRDAKVRLLLEKLPDRLRDRLIASRLWR